MALRVKFWGHATEPVGAVGWHPQLKPGHGPIDRQQGRALARNFARASNSTALSSAGACRLRFIHRELERSILLFGEEFVVGLAVNLD
jgi:hypothetical protein